MSGGNLSGTRNEDARHGDIYRHLRVVVEFLVSDWAHVFPRFILVEFEVNQVLGAHSLASHRILLVLAEVRDDIQEVEYVTLLRGNRVLERHKGEHAVVKGHLYRREMCMTLLERFGA